ncbi:MAG: serine/threonine protein kinase [Drouetiella hepatica Uher 2000/2452]|jgi:serine/threonine protein kinase|uniref:Serine/threonine protein kinase n=1 Tax=Drouetiella hepatica Uher 2000/2452 TaxID=904376 RepID=A0A951ULB4_9CYAN|nr:serine/threonine protein kinase [Drouetiella hepatica Uher 2000/2452]
MVIALSQPNSLSSQPNPWSGRLVGDRYRVNERLGSGGMGDVFLATDIRLGKPVAVKLLRESLALAEDLDFKRRFERECAICAALKSPHIVQVSDYGVTAEGYPFYVMEYLQGQPLDQLLFNQPRLSVTRTCNIMTQICAGLQLAHEGVVLWSGEVASSERIKVIHRDLKPANIFLVPSALGEFVKVIDFGIAKIHSLQAEFTSATSVFLGTCHYASPEQFDIRGEVDERSDIYSLGVILYEMLAGIDPFGFDFRAKRVSNDVWLTAHATQPVKPLRSQPNCDSISPELEAVVMRCLEKSPGDRFVSVAALSKALQSANAETPINSLLLAPATGQQPAPSQTDLATVARSPLATPVPGSSSLGSSSLGSPSRAVSPLETASQQSGRKFPLLLMGGGVLLALAIGIYALPQVLQSSQPNGTSTAQLASSIRTFSVAKTLKGNSHPVWSAVLSPDEQTLISGGEDKDAAGQFYPIKIWDIKTGQMQRTLEGHLAAIRSLSLSQNGQILASSGGDNTIKVWDVPTGKLLHTLEGHAGSVWSVALSKDGQTLISGSEDTTVRVWDLRTENSRVLAEHAAVVYSVALSPDGKTIASGSADKTIRMWDLATGELIRTLGEPGGHRDTVRAVAFSPNGEQLASVGWDGFVKSWDSTTGQLLQTFEGHSDRVDSVTFINDRMLASASLDKTIKIWDTQNGQMLQNIPAHSNWVLSVNAQPAAQSLVSSSSDTTIKLWQ